MNRRRKQGLPKRTDNNNPADHNQGSGSSSGCNSSAETELEADEMTTNTLEDSSAPNADTEQESMRSVDSPPDDTSPPRMAQSPVQLLKMKDQAELLSNNGISGVGVNALDQLLLKAGSQVAGGGGGGSPFLLPAQFLALNPGLYAAQLAQLQAAHLMLARHQQEAALLMAGQSRAAGSGISHEASTKKRAATDDNESDNEHSDDEGGHRYRQKLARSSSPMRTGPSKAEIPLDLSGNRSPESQLKTERPTSPLAPNAGGYFHPLMPAGLLSLFNQFRPPALAPTLPFSATSPRKSPRSPSPPPTPPSYSRPGATSAWQSQWASSRGSTGGTAEHAKPEDVFKCVWCRESYHTLEDLTRHMKEAKHHHGLPASFPGSHGGSQMSASPQTGTSNHHVGSSMAAANNNLPSPPKTSRDVLRDQMPLPRKLVRGQDVWIGRADEQTRDILKCMGCGQSFRSLDLLTKHMQETQHYKKVISHDQLSSWKYQDSHQPGAAPSHKNHVNSVLSCKVCDKGFGTLKELSDHMVRANHYAGEVKMGGRQTSMMGMAGGVGHTPAAAASSPSSKERKKALPVKKLLELERARQEVAGNFPPISTREILESGKLLCERCEERVPIDIFIPHIQQCVGRPRFLGSATSPRTISPAASAAAVHRNGGTALKPASGSTSDKEADTSFSILGSLEQLVKGNFHGSHTATTNSGGSNINPYRPGATSASTAAAVPLKIDHQFASEHNKFSISSLFPSKVSPVPSSASGESSRPVSPALARPRSSAPSEEAPDDAKRNGESSSPLSALAPNGKQEESSRHRQPAAAYSPVGSPIDSPVAAAAAQDNTDDGSHIPKDQTESVKATAAARSPLPVSGSPVGGAISPTARQSATAVSSDRLSPSKSPGGGNALAALQMFCEDQKKTTAPRNTGGSIKEAGGSGAALGGSPLSDPGAILAFSWACNQAVAGGGDSAAAIKCPFCETPFISKGAYRHHLSKMHFTKENMGSGPSAAGFLIPTAAASGGPSATGGGGVGGGATRTPSPDTKDAEETLQSKYQKYSQLAKQLSCYDGTN